MVLSQNMLVVLGSSTHIVAERSDGNSGKINLTKGFLLGKLNSAAVNVRQNWEFKTPLAVCGVRGTEYAIEYSPEAGMRLGVFEGEVDVQEAEGPQGFPPMVRIGARHEAFIARGKPLKRLDAFSPSMEKLRAQRPDLRNRFNRMNGTWTPFTPTTRLEHRKKFITRAKLRPKRIRPNPRRKAAANKEQGLGF